METICVCGITSVRLSLTSWKKTASWVAPISLRSGSVTCPAEPENDRYRTSTVGCSRCFIEDAINVAVTYGGNTEPKTMSVALKATVVHHLYFSIAFGASCTLMYLNVLSAIAP